MLAGEGRSLKEQRETAQRSRAFLTEKNIETIQRARSVVREQAPLLSRSTNNSLPEVETITATLNDPELPSKIKEVASASVAIDSAYRTRYGLRHAERLSSYDTAIHRIMDHADYRAVETSEAERALAGLRRRAAEAFDLPPYAASDRITGATLATLEDDLELLPALEAGARSRLAQLRDAGNETEEAVEVIRLGDFLSKTQAPSDFSEPEIDEALEKLRQKLFRLRELKRRVLWD
jgi:hypothetical protein